MKLWIGKCKTQNIVTLHSSEPYYSEEFDRWDPRGEGFITGFSGNNFPEVTFEKVHNRLKLNWLRRSSYGNRSNTNCNQGIYCHSCSNTNCDTFY